MYLREAYFQNLVLLQGEWKIIVNIKLKVELWVFCGIWLNFYSILFGVFNTNSFVHDSKRATIDFLEEFESLNFQALNQKNFLPCN